MAAQLLRAPANTVYFSALAAWEVALLYSLGRLTLPQPPEVFVPAQCVQHGFDYLPLFPEVALYLTNLPRLHRDPFDRMLVCQAAVHGMVLVTPDAAIRQYPITTAW